MLADRHRRHHHGRPVAGDEPDAVAERHPRRLRLDLGLADGDAPRSGPDPAGQQLQRLVDPGSEQAGEPDDLAPPNGERDAVETAGGDVLHPPDRRPGRLLVAVVADGRHRRGAREQQIDDPVLGDGLVLERRDVLPVAHHRHAATRPDDVVDVVRDEDDRAVLADQAAHRLEHPIGFARGQAGGRLVEDQQLRVLLGRAARDRQDPAVDRGQALDGRVERQLVTEHLERAPGPRPRLLAAHGAPPARLGPEDHALPHRVLGRQGDLLGHQQDALLAHAAKVAAERLAVEDDRAAVRLQQSGDHLQRGRLPAAVGPDQADHLPPADDQLAVGDGVDAAEALAQPVRFEQRRRVGDRGHAFDPTFAIRTVTSSTAPWTTEITHSGSLVIRRPFSSVCR